MKTSTKAMEVDANIVLLFLCCVAVRWATSLNSYSGEGKPPMFGDYEAQRHWMEITYHLPINEWYHQTKENDLQYWGLDYPPLTAYHSYAMGALADKINSSWVALGESRGAESYSHKLFMRYSVLLADILVYFPAVFLYFRNFQGTMEKKVLQTATTLLYPGLILIDHGHFQYNCISLGFAVWAVLFLVRGNELLGAAAFTLALNYKQMELYHAMPFFCYLLGMSFKGKENWFIKLVKIGTVVILTFVCCWLPFLKSVDSIRQVLHRLFPFARGIYEDKVANFWCSLSVLIKFRTFLETGTLVKLCLGTTFIGLLPSSIHLLRNPSVRNFKYALLNSSLVFFLFSFQVHEKSILLVAMPACLLLGDHAFVCCWLLLISTFSMLPLLIYDGLTTVYVVSMVIFSVLSCIHVQMHTPPGNLSKSLFAVSMIGCIILTVASLTVTAPAHLPDLFPVLVSCYSCLHFLLFLVYFTYTQIFGKPVAPVRVTERPKQPVKAAEKSKQSPKAAQKPKQSAKQKKGRNTQNTKSRKKKDN